MTENSKPQQSEADRNKLSAVMLGRRRMDKNMFLPMPVTIIGTTIDDRPNFMTAGWVARVNAEPARIGVSISRDHATADAIIKNGSFSVCVPGHDILSRVDQCGVISGRDFDKSALFSHFYGVLKDVPMIVECPVCMECSLHETLSGESNYFFIGNIEAVHADPKCLSGESTLDPEMAGFIILTMPDNRYWSLGMEIGRAWSIGKSRPLPPVLGDISDDESIPLDESVPNGGPASGGTSADSQIRKRETRQDEEFFDEA